jgi:hypothetical protein
MLELFLAMQVAAATPATPTPRDPAELQCLSEPSLKANRELAAAEAFHQLGGGNTNAFSAAAFKTVMTQLDSCSQKFGWSESIKGAAKLHLLGDLSQINMRATYAINNISLAKLDQVYATGRRGEGDSPVTATDQKMLTADLLAQGLKRSEEEAGEVVYVYFQLLDITQLGKQLFVSGKGM